MVAVLSKKEDRSSEALVLSTSSLFNDLADREVDDTDDVDNNWLLLIGRVLRFSQGELVNPETSEYLATKQRQRTQFRSIFFGWYKVYLLIGSL